MKWFKHQTNARNDERVAHLESLAGLEGYGFYIKLLEIVAEGMDRTDKCSITYPLTTWSHQLYIHHNKVSKLLGKCEVAGLVSVKYHEGNSKVRIEVTIPNLLKYRDNHTSNLKVNNKQEIEVEVEVEVEVEKKEKEKEIKKPSMAFALPDWIDKSVWDLWMQTRKGKKMIPAQMQAQVNKLEKWKESGIDYSSALSASAEAGWAGLFEPKMQRGGAVSSQSENDQIREAARKRIFGEQPIESI